MTASCHPTNQYVSCSRHVAPPLFPLSCLSSHSPAYVATKQLGTASPSSRICTFSKTIASSWMSLSVYIPASHILHAMGENLLEYLSHHSIYYLNTQAFVCLTAVTSASTAKRLCLFNFSQIPEPSPSSVGTSLKLSTKRKFLLCYFRIIIDNNNILIA